MSKEKETKKEETKKDETSADDNDDVDEGVETDSKGPVEKEDDEEPKPEVVKEESEPEKEEAPETDKADNDDNDDKEDKAEPAKEEADKPDEKKAVEKEEKIAAVDSKDSSKDETPAKEEDEAVVPEKAAASIEKADTIEEQQGVETGPSNEPNDADADNTPSPMDAKAQHDWEKAEAEAERIRLEEETKMSRRDELLHPKRQPFQQFVHMVSLFAILAAFNMAVGQILGPALYEVSPIQWILRVYVTALCFVMILVEFQWTEYARSSSILRRWMPRGVFYIFLGVLGLEENEKSTFRDVDRRGLALVQTYVDAVAWIVVGVGFGYILLGATCMQNAYNAQCQEYQEKCSTARDIRKGKITQEEVENPTKVVEEEMAGDEAV